MRKRIKGRIFSRKIGPRKALIVSIARSLAQKEKIQTTQAKAKAVSSFIEGLITKAKKNDLSARRELLVYFQAPVVKKIMEDIAPRFASRNGGYTRVLKMAPRKSDGARMAIIEFVK